MALISISITPENLIALDSSVNKTFEDSLIGAVDQTNWDMLATETNVSVERGIYDFVYSSFRLEELLKGEMIFSNAKRTAFSIESKDRGQGLEISRNDLMDGKLGTLTTQTRQMARAIAWSPQDLVTNLIKNGETANSYDGVPFFSNSHPVDLADVGLGTYDNLITSFALSATNLGIAIAAMQSFQGPDGHSRGITPNILLVPPQLAMLATNLTGSQYLDASSNPYLTNIGIQVMVINDLMTDPTSWYLASGNDQSPTGLNPFIYQVRENYTIQSFTSTDDYTLSVSNKFAWLVRGRDAVGYGHPFQMIKAKA